MCIDWKQEIKYLLRKEQERQENELTLIASENYASKDVLEACGSCIQNKYSEGYPGKRYYGGCEVVDTIEKSVKQLVNKAFKTTYSNVQSHCGSSANLAVYLAATKYFKCEPNKLTIISHSLDAGAHLTHGAKVSVSGTWFKTQQLELNGCEFNYKGLEEALTNLCGPAVVVVGFSAYPREVHYDKISKIIKDSEKEVIVLCDVSHIAGLIVTGYHKNPVDYDWGKSKVVITSTVHKTLRGARHAVITTNDETLAKLIDKSVFPGLNGGPLQNMIAGTGIAFAESLSPEFKAYIGRVLANRLMMEMVFEQRGIKMVSGGSDTHMLLLDLRSTGLTGKQAEDLLAEYGIITNKNTIPGDMRPKSETSGLRIGTPAITTRGLEVEDCYTLANHIADILLGKVKDKQALKDYIKTLCKNHPIYPVDK